MRSAKRPPSQQNHQRPAVLVGQKWVISAISSCLRRFPTAPLSGLVSIKVGIPACSTSHPMRRHWLSRVGWQHTRKFSATAYCTILKSSSYRFMFFKDFINRSDFDGYDHDNSWWLALMIADDESLWWQYRAVDNRTAIPLHYTNWQFCKVLEQIPETMVEWQCWTMYVIHVSFHILKIGIGHAWDD